FGPLHIRDIGQAEHSSNAGYIFELPRQIANSSQVLGLEQVRTRDAHEKNLITAKYFPYSVVIHIFRRSRKNKGRGRSVKLQILELPKEETCQERYQHERQNGVTEEPGPALVHVALILETRRRVNCYIGREWG